MDTVIAAVNDILSHKNVSSLKELGRKLLLEKTELFRLGYAKRKVTRTARKSEHDFLGRKVRLLDKFKVRIVVDERPIPWSMISNCDQTGSGP